MATIVEYIKSDMRDFALQLSTILEEFGVTPEARTEPPFVPPDPYEEIAALRARVQVLEETMRSAGIALPLYPLDGQVSFEIERNYK